MSPNRPDRAGEVLAEPDSSDASAPPARGLFGVLVTYKRPELLKLCLDRVARQARPPDRLIVVDNDPLHAGAPVVAGWPSSPLAVEYLEAPENLGPAGGFNLGIEAILSEANDEDLVALFDDNDPIASIDVLGELTRFFDEMSIRDPATAGVGTRGSPFDYRRALTTPVPTERLCGPVEVDHLTGDGVPVYLAGPLRRAGAFDSSLFFGFEELELGLRLRDAGHRFYLHGDLATRIRTVDPPRERSHTPAAGLDPATWVRYYGLRNLLCILLRHGYRASALRVALVRGFGKPLANLPRSPRLAFAHLSLNWRAIADARAGRLGRTLDPEGY